MTENAPGFAQSLHKMKGRKFAEKTDKHLDFIDDYTVPGDKTK